MCLVERKRNYASALKKYFYCVINLSRKEVYYDTSRRIFFMENTGFCAQSYVGHGIVSCVLYNLGISI